MIFTLVLEEITINPFKETSICPLVNDIELSKSGMAVCHGDYVIELGSAKIWSFCLIAMLPSIISGKTF